MMSREIMKVAMVEVVPCHCSSEFCYLYGPNIRRIHQVVVDKQYGLGPDHNCETYKSPWRKGAPRWPFQFIKDYASAMRLAYIIVLLRNKLTVLLRLDLKSWVILDRVGVFKCHYQ